LIVGSAFAAYAAIVSTLSLILSVRVYRAGGPDVDIDWEYHQKNRRLSLSILNTGRADVTITGVDLRIIHEQIFNRSPSGKYFNSRMDIIEEVPTELWWPDLGPETFPVRLTSNSLLTTQVRSRNFSDPRRDLSQYEQVIRLDRGPQTGQMPR
jgi:hypothetical protein